MFSVFCFLIVAASVSQDFVASVITTRPVVILSFDGIHANEVNENNTPFLYTTLKKISAGPEYVKTAFPSKTFVTHYTASTGVHPEQHGVICNKMFDNNGNEVFNLPEQFQTDPTIVPIWITNQVSGNNSAVMMWPGSEFTYNGVKPKHFKQYNPNLDWDQRIKIMIRWMGEKEKPVNLLMAYFEDSSNQDDSPNESGKTSYLKKVDNAIKKIYEELVNLGLGSDLDLIILSDHGTYPVTKDKFLIVNNYIKDIHEEEMIGQGPNVLIRPSTDKFESTYKALKTSPDHEVKFNVYKKNEIPANWHLGKSSNLDNILLLVAKLGYTFFEQSEFDRLKNVNETIQENGYDNNEKSMNAFFWGIGPGFKNNEFPKESIEIIEIYPLLLKLLNLEVNGVQADQKMSNTMESLLENLK